MTIAKAHKIIRINDVVPCSNKANAIKGVWLINHTFETEIQGGGLVVTGEFEAVVCYSYANESKIDMSPKTIVYQEKIPIHVYDENRMSDDCRVITKVLQHPICVREQINGYNVELDCQFELLAEIGPKLNVGEEVVIINDIINGNDGPIGKRGTIEGIANGGNYPYKLKMQDGSRMVANEIEIERVNQNGI
jgi:hypothetical protein